MGRNWKNFEVQDSRNLDYFEETCQITNVERVTRESSEGNKEDDGEHFYHLREHIYHHEKIVNRNMNIKCASCEVSKEIRNWRKGYLCYKMAQNLAELCSTVE